MELKPHSKCLFSLLLITAASPSSAILHILKKTFSTKRSKIIAGSLATGFLALMAYRLNCENTPDKKKITEENGTDLPVVTPETLEKQELENNSIEKNKPIKTFILEAFGKNVGGGRKNRKILRKKKKPNLSKTFIQEEFDLLLSVDENDKDDRMLSDALKELNTPLKITPVNTNKKDTEQDKV